MLTLLLASQLACTGELEITREIDSGTAPARVISELAPRHLSETLQASLPTALIGEPNFSGLEIHTASDPAFPEPLQLGVNARENPALQRYAGLPGAARSLDLFLTDPLDRYWLSEYEHAGRPVRFRCDFLLHLEPRTGGGTSLEVIEVSPHIWPRNRFRFFGHKGPGRYRDILPVAPTARDLATMARLVRAALNSAQPAATRASSQAQSSPP